MPQILIYKKKITIIIQLIMTKVNTERDNYKNKVTVRFKFGKSKVVGFSPIRTSLARQVGFFSYQMLC